MMSLLLGVMMMYLSVSIEKAPVMAVAAPATAQ